MGEGYKKSSKKKFNFIAKSQYFTKGNFTSERHYKLIVRLYRKNVGGHAALDSSEIMKTIFPYQFDEQSMHSEHYHDFGCSTPGPRLRAILSLITLARF